MCVMSMIADHYRDKWAAPTYSREEFDQLKREVAEMIALMKKAKKYDADTGQPDCETDEKMALLRKVAKHVGIDLDKAIGGA